MLECPGHLAVPRFAGNRIRFRASA
jgi:hypothetical protein